jgi:hypothetical protein
LALCPVIFLSCFLFTIARPYFSQMALKWVPSDFLVSSPFNHMNHVTLGDIDLMHASTVTLCISWTGMTSDSN